MLTHVVLLLMLAVCAYTDVSRRLIYNRVLVPCAAFGVAYGWIRYGGEGLAQSLAGAALGFLLLLLPFLLGGLGAGDVKMLAAVGALEGPEFAFRAFVVSALVGGVWALADLVRRRRLKAVFTSLFVCGLGWLYGVRAAPVFAAEEGEAGLPYGAVLALGTALAWLGGWGA
ncbi:MAG: prepilin peptidase [Moorellales bacterium]